ncbi:16S rRNA (cytidine(1402)-2'-O)-methyltransferase [Dehalococcoidia bacterium]|nr:16S rRNA (cytidine(1402)-2'-O)-methyltransferase [Dehalococcoidia bacterium]
MPTLYLVGTPIGNLEDITLRALRVLKDVSLIAAEDTRRARILLRHYQIDTPLTSYHEQGRGSKTAPLIKQLINKDIALISDAGMPTISDPGYVLATEALAKKFRVEVVPGPSAVTMSLVLSGLPSDQFVFLGFLPRTTGKRRRFLGATTSEPRTLVAFEAPHRIKACLSDISELFGDRPIAVCRELTKIHEEVYRGTASGAAVHFRHPRGEFTIILQGDTRTSANISPDIASGLLSDLRSRGSTGRDAVAQVAAETGLPKREIYRLWVSLERAGTVNER